MLPGRCGLLLRGPGGSAPMVPLTHCAARPRRSLHGPHPPVPICSWEAAEPLSIKNPLASGREMKRLWLLPYCFLDFAIPGLSEPAPPSGVEHSCQNPVLCHESPAPGFHSGREEALTPVQEGSGKKGRRLPWKGPRVCRDISPVAF